MPKVPTVGLNASPLPGFQAPGVTAFRSAVPQQIQQSGKAMEGLGKAVTEVAFKIEDDINDAATLEANNAFEKFTQKSFQGFGQLKGQEAMRAKSGVLNDQDFERKAILEKLENNVQRKQFAKFADRLQSKFTLKVEEHYIGAVAENKQQQLLSTQTTIEDDIKANPLSPESISSFLRWQKTTEQIIAGQGIQGDLAKTVMTKRSSDFIKSIFNNYVDAGRPEDALKFVEAIQSFEENIAYDMKSARAAGLGPDETGHYPSRDPNTGLILKSQDHPTFHKTVKGEIEAGYEFWQDPKTERWYTFPKGVVDNPESRGLEKKDPPLLQGMTSPEQVSLLDGETRMLLRQKAEKVSMDTWAVTTADQQSSYSSALELAEEKFTKKEWTASQRELFERAASNKFKRQAEAKRTDQLVLLDSAREEVAVTGALSENTKDKLIDAGVYAKFLGGSGTSSSGRGSTSKSTEQGKAWALAYGHPREYDRWAKGIRKSSDLISIINQLRINGVEGAELKNYVEGIKKSDFFTFGEKETETILTDVGVGTVSQIEKNIGAFYTEQINPQIYSTSSEGGEATAQDEAAIAFLKGQEPVFTQRVLNQVRELRKADPKSTDDQLLQQAMATVWNDEKITYSEDGRTKTANGWLLDPSEKKAMIALANPQFGSLSMGQLSGVKRVVGKDDDPRRDQTVLAEARRRLLLKYPTVAQRDRSQAKTAQMAAGLDAAWYRAQVTGGPSYGLNMRFDGRSEAQIRYQPTDLQILTESYKVMAEDFKKTGQFQLDLSTRLAADVAGFIVDDSWMTVSDRQVRNSPNNQLRRRVYDPEYKKMWVDTMGMTADSFDLALSRIMFQMGSDEYDRRARSTAKEFLQKYAAYEVDETGVKLLWKNGHVLRSTKLGGEQ
tara:strand:- start:381 stop:3059 length:2679 start_codon:yes stop_codon:yes gene_type:complete